jgi:hypothetical protein
LNQVCALSLWIECLLRVEMSKKILQLNPPESGSEIGVLASATMGLCGLMASPGA